MDKKKCINLKLMINMFINSTFRNNNKLEVFKKSFKFKYNLYTSQKSLIRLLAGKNINVVTNKQSLLSKNKC